MTQIFTIVSLFLHVLATVILIGHYLLLALVTLPALEKSLKNDQLFGVLNDMSVKFRLWSGLALLGFIISGVYLMFVDPQYPGFGNIFANLWTILMVSKHVVVIVMIVLAMALPNLINKAQASASDPDQTLKNLARIKGFLLTTNVCGLVVLVLTTAAQIF